MFAVPAIVIKSIPAVRAEVFVPNPEHDAVSALLDLSRASSQVAEPNKPQNSQTFRSPIVTALTHKLQHEPVKAVLVNTTSAPAVTQKMSGQVSFKQICCLASEQLPLELARFVHVVSSTCHGQGKEVVSRLLMSFFHDVLGFRLDLVDFAIAQDTIANPSPPVLSKLVSHALFINARQHSQNHTLGNAIPWEHAFLYCNNFNKWTQQLKLPTKPSPIPSWFAAFHEHIQSQADPTRSQSMQTVNRTAVFAK
mmetsp:Transcript_1032/g.1973  ORF Transcript_1032/g.1973 Transcript_1032/m.1973 type:complete len:252 (+) Transcript_1032:44-799(+)